MHEQRRILFTVVSGFLGAGKSTLMNKLLQETSRRTTILVNDFGPINIDAALIEQREGESISLVNGCACCTIGGGLSESISNTMERTPPPEWIVIEASGVADPRRIAQIGIVDQQLELESIVVLVDASAVLEHMQDPLVSDTITRQLDSATLILLSKESLDPASTVKVKEWLAQNYADVPMLSAESPTAVWNTEVNSHSIKELLAKDDHSHDEHQHHDHHADGSCCCDENCCDETHEHNHEHNHELHPFQTWFWKPARAVNLELLKAILKKMPRNVIRAKGWVSCERGVRLVQYAGLHTRVSEVTPINEVPDGLVVIATKGVNQSDINQLLDAAVTDLF